MVYHEHPAQRGACLPGAFASYVTSIPLQGYDDLDSAWQAIRQRPFEADWGQVTGACIVSPCPLPRVPSDATDARCSPPQRSRVWPDRMNCWEATAHFAAAAERFLPEQWTLHVWDRDLSNGTRHMWPSLLTPSGDHLLVDLQTVAARKYPSKPYRGLVKGVSTTANGTGNDVLGGVHLAGDKVLRVIGLGGLSDALSKVEGDALPDWSRTEDQIRQRQTEQTDSDNPSADDGGPKGPASEPTKQAAPAPERSSAPGKRRRGLLARLTTDPAQRRTKDGGT